MIGTNEEIILRLRGHLSSLGRELPGIWQEVDQQRAKLKRIFNWPAWCFMPMAGYFGILAGDRSNFHAMQPSELGRMIRAVQRLAALYPWRITQGIYRFHPELEDEIARTELTGDLPVSLFYRLPEWCVYIQRQARIQNTSCHGFFAHLEWDINHRRPELRFLVDTEDGLIAIPLHLREGSIEDALKAVISEAQSNIERYGLDGDRAIRELGPGGYSMRISLDDIKQMASLVLYLCSMNADVVHPEEPRRKPRLPQPRKVKGGRLRYFPAQKPSFWHVGYTIGEALNRLRERVATGSSGTRSNPRPHIRRAHWHSYWVGPRSRPERRKLVVRWLHPIIVAGSQKDIIPTIKTIEKPR